MSFVEPELAPLRERMRQTSPIDWTIAVMGILGGLMFILNSLDVISVNKGVNLLPPIVILAVALRKWQQGRANG